MSKDNRKKVLMIGVDGAEPSIIFDLARRGVLPNFRRLIQAGSYGRLRSTIPSHTVPAWTSSVTGVNPGRHGLYDFFLSHDLRSKRIEYANSKKRRQNAIWNILSESGKKVVIMNVPVTYPPEKVNGVMVSGMLTPGSKTQFTYPSSVKEEILGLGYQIDLGGTLLDILLKRADGKVKMLSLINEMIKKRNDVAKYMMSQFEWDLFMVVFVGLDRLQHWYWNFIDPTHISYEKNESKLIHDDIMRVYLEIDTSIGDLIKNSGKNTNVIIYSDHGFRSVNKFFFINNYLRKNGILKVDQEQVQNILNQESMFNIIKTLNIEYIINILPNNLKRLMGKIIPPSKNYIDVNNLNDEYTKAYQYSQFIRLNKEILNEEEEEKIITKIITMFKNMDTGINIYRREEIFKGPETVKIPNLVLNPIKDVTPSQFITANGNLEKDYDASIKIPSLMRSGDHSQWGLYVLTGPQISKSLYRDSNILDIAPTVLDLLEHKIPQHMEGEVLKYKKN